MGSKCCKCCKDEPEQSTSVQIRRQNDSSQSSSRTTTIQSRPALSPSEPERSTSVQTRRQNDSSQSSSRTTTIQSRRALSPSEPERSTSVQTRRQNDSSQSSARTTTIQSSRALSASAISLSSTMPELSAPFPLNKDYFVDITSPKTIQSFQSFFKDSWLYEDQRGMDAYGLDKFKGLQVKQVFQILNKDLLQTYLQRLESMQCKAKLRPNPQLEVNKDLGNLVLTKNLKEDDFGDVPCEESVNEFYMFHGTTSENSNRIAESGFIVEKAEKIFYGKGLYFADSAMKSDQYADFSKGKDPDSRKSSDLAMLVVRVILGNVYFNTDGQSFDRPPCVDHTDCDKPDCEEHDQYDSVLAGFDKRFREFLVYDSRNCFPQFLIVYDRILK